MPKIFATYNIPYTVLVEKKIVWKKFWGMEGFLILYMVNLCYQLSEGLGQGLRENFSWTKVKETAQCLYVNTGPW